MKVAALFPLAAVAVLGLFAFGLAEDIVARLGMKHKTAQRYILGNFTGDFKEPGAVEEDHGGAGEESASAQLNAFQIPYARLRPSIVKGDKAAAARDLCAYVRLYVNSQEFLNDYSARREAAKPTEEPYRPSKTELDHMRKSLKEAEASYGQAKNAPGMTREALTAYEKGLAQMRKQLADYEDPTPNKTRWLKTYPEDPSIAVKARLEEYLQLAATVDFNAELTGGNRKKFVNPAYEKKSLKWKAIYRAGREVNGATTAFVKEWLKGEIVSAKKSTLPAEITDDRPVSGKKPAEAGQPSAPVPAQPGSASSSPDQPAAAQPAKEAEAKEKKSLFKKLKEKVASEL